MKPGDIITVMCDWYSVKPLRVRLVRRYEHPAGNGWVVVHYDPHSRRFRKIEHTIGDETFASQGEAVKA